MKSVRRVVGTGAVALTVLASACSSGDDTTAPPPLAGSGAGEIGEIVEKDPVTGTVDFYMPADSKPALPPGADPEQAAIDYLQANGDKLGIPDAKGSYEPAGAGKDEDDATTHVKLQQVSNGIEVWGVLTTVHFDENGFVDAVDGAHVPNLDAIAKQMPAVDEATAKVTAEAEARVVVPGATAVTMSTAGLVIYVDDDYSNPRLARHLRVYVRTAQGRQSAEIFIDAMDGSVLDSWNDSSNANEQREARAQGYDKQPHTTPVMWDGFVNRHGRFQTSTQSQLITGRFLGEKEDKWTNFESSSVDGPWDPQAVSAILNIDRAERFYLQDLKYEGPSGKRSNIWVQVRDPNDGNWNAYAFWSDDGQSDTLAFTSRADGMRAPVICLDVVAHEFTHLVTAYNGKLVYRKQPGAINEAVSDIFGAFVERKIQGRSNNSFLVAEASGEAIRDMRHPRRACETCPDNYRDVRTAKKAIGDPKDKNYNDNGFVHSNSSIVNNAWALTVEGGTNDTSKLSVADGIGWDKSIKLWWKTQRHLLAPRMTIPRLARLQSGLAKKSKGRFDAEIVACSWAAVDGVSVDWARTKLKVSCTAKPPAEPGASDGGAGGGEVPTYCQGKADGTYCSEADKFLGYICKDQAMVKALQCPPPNTVCTGVSADGQSLICTN